MNQWQTAALQPPHLTAMCAWEGASDYYRELCRHGGILSDFLDGWYLRQVKSVQYGVGSRAHVNPNTGRSVAGDITLSDDVLASRRAETHLDAQNHELLDDFYRARIPDYSKIKTPLLSAGNWGGIGLHPRGNFERLSAVSLRAEMAGGSWGYALFALLFQLRPPAAKEILWPLPEG